jgi:hypothetical protein
MNWDTFRDSSSRSQNTKPVIQRLKESRHKGQKGKPRKKLMKNFIAIQISIITRPT